MELSHGFSAEYRSPSSESCRARANFESNLDFGAVAELKKSSDNDNSTQAAPVQKVEAVPAEQETEAAPVDVDYEVKSEDNSTSDNTEA